MYEELIRALREPWQYENCICVLCQQAADAIEELSKMVSANDARAYLDRDALMNTLMEHKRSYNFEDRYGDFGMGFSEAIKIVAMTYPVYAIEPPKEE